MTIGGSEGVRRAHNSFASPNPFLSDESLSSGKDDDAYHFIAYVPFEGELWELDGLKPAPIRLAECNEVCASHPQLPAVQAFILDSVRCSPHDPGGHQPPYQLMHCWSQACRMQFPFPIK